MAGKKAPNKFMIAIVVGVIAVFLIVVISKRGPKYTQVTSLPSYDQGSAPQDGDTQADTIRALQAYAKEAVGKAEKLNNQTQKQHSAVLKNSRKVQKLEDANAALGEANQKMSSYALTLEKKLETLKQQIDSVETQQQSIAGNLDANGIPVGFGFDHLKKKSDEVGQWHDPIDKVEEKKGGNKYTGLLTPPTGNRQRKTDVVKNNIKKENPADAIVPAFTIPKDSVLYDGISLTALIGRIPVEGTTPDPYPVKIFIGKENLAANGHQLPEVDGMIFSGLAIGDWNLSCVSVRLFSASYIFEDGNIVNHTVKAEPLGYISDRAGWPCVSGVFKTNAPKFLRDRIGLSGLNAAGSAYANAQASRRESELTGTTTTSITGSIDKLLAGTLVKSATDEASQWILARQKQSFDAVIVGPGAEVSIHLDKALTLDESQLDRKIRYSRHTDLRRKTLH